MCVSLYKATYLLYENFDRPLLSLLKMTLPSSVSLHLKILR